MIQRVPFQVLQGFAFGIWLKVKGGYSLGCKDSGLGLEIWGSGLCGLELGFFRVWGSGFRVTGKLQTKKNREGLLSPRISRQGLRLVRYYQDAGLTGVYPA